MKIKKEAFKLITISAHSYNVDQAPYQSADIGRLHENNKEGIWKYLLSSRTPKLGTNPLINRLI